MVHIKLFSDCLTLEIGPISCPETSVTSYECSCVTSQKNGDLIYVAAGAWSRASWKLISFKKLPHS